MDEKENKAGIYYEIAEKIEKATGLKAEIELLPFKRMINGLENGNIDCAIFFTSTERQKKFTQVWYGS